MSGLSNLVSPSKKRATLSNQRVPDTQVAAQMSSSEAKNLHSVNDETDEDQPRRIIKRKSKTVVLKVSIIVRLTFVKVSNFTV